MIVLLRHSTDAAPTPLHVEPADHDASDGFVVRCGDVHRHVQLAGGGNRGWIEIDGRVLPLHVLQTGDGFQVWIKGRVYRFERVDQTARRTAATKAVTARTELTAPMPGTILKIRATPGAAFAAHESLVIIESMKMEMTLSVPHAGRVLKVLCREGQLVDSGAVLAKLEPNEDAAASA